MKITYEIQSLREGQWVKVKKATPENWQKEWRRYANAHPTEQTQVMQIIDSHTENLVF